MICCPLVGSQLEARGHGMVELERAGPEGFSLDTRLSLSSLRQFLLALSLRTAIILLEVSASLSGADAGRYTILSYCSLSGWAYTQHALPLKGSLD
jgi:hypothetical protein